MSFESLPVCDVSLFISSSVVNSEELSSSVFEWSSPSSEVVITDFLLFLYFLIRCRGKKSNSKSFWALSSDVSMASKRGIEVLPYSSYCSWILLSEGLIISIENIEDSILYYLSYWSEMSNVFCWILSSYKALAIVLWDPWFIVSLSLSSLITILIDHIQEGFLREGVVDDQLEDYCSSSITLKIDQTLWYCEVVRLGDCSSSSSSNILEADLFLLIIFLFFSFFLYVFRLNIWKTEVKIKIRIFIKKICIV